VLAEWLMERYGWRDVWYLGSNRPERYRHWWNFIGPSACYVGVWTGPELDLLCVRRCTTRGEAEENLSPPGWTQEKTERLRPLLNSQATLPGSSG